MNTPTSRRLLPSDLTIRSITSDDQELVDSFIGPERIAEMKDSGFTESDEVTTRQLISLVSAGVLRGWFVTLPGHGALSIQTYAPTGVAGVWSGECVTAPEAATLGFRGVGTACMALAMDALFDDPQVHRLMGYVAVTNTASLRMCERLGFRREGLAREQMPIGDGKRSDAAIMAILRREWEGAATIEKKLIAS
ncbi:GNAT family protein [Microbispora hainanensis]|uniref:GNAT family N-acetyltransferase n=1 Tax=Microbispora hainanensis TaxID=568844 RepID=A0ABZ1SJ76_9ACTN|nr:GNAT family protein [Microbispora hainanensis]